MRVCVCCHMCTCEVCPVPEAEINMKSVAIFTQIILHTADSQFQRTGVCVCWGSCYVHTIQLLWRTGRSGSCSLNPSRHTCKPTHTNDLHDSLDTFKRACVHVPCVCNSWTKATVVVGQLILCFGPFALPIMHVFDQRHEGCWLTCSCSSGVGLGLCGGRRKALADITLNTHSHTPVAQLLTPPNKLPSALSALSSSSLSPSLPASSLPKRASSRNTLIFGGNLHVAQLSS